jgi:hypothetical protein
MPILAIYDISTNYTFTVGGQRFGFMDAHHEGREGSLLCAGPLGTYYKLLPVSAVNAWIVTCLLVASLILASVWFGLRLRAMRQRRNYPGLHN